MVRNSYIKSYSYVAGMKGDKNIKIISYWFKRLILIRGSGVRVSEVITVFGN